MPLEDSTALAQRAAARVGTTVLGKWHVDALLGVGGMAAVYAATHRNGKRAALKFLHPEMLFSEVLRARFLREGHVANRVGHPGAVSVLDDQIAEDGSAFLVMELLEGETLEQKWRNHGTLTCAEVLELADQLLDVLVAAHQRDIIHRDLKPANIFVCADGTTKVLDFGIARLRELSSTGQTVGQVTTMSSMGTPCFMPPEQARGRWEQVDARSDLWALGATLFALLTGRFVHVEETVNEQLLASMTKPAPKLLDVAPGLPAPLAEIVDRALAFAQADRWPDARAMQKAVREARAALGSEALSSLHRVPRASERASGEAPTLAAASAPTLAASSLSAQAEEHARSAPAGSPTPKGTSWRRTLALAAIALTVVAVGAATLGRGEHAVRAHDDATSATRPPEASAPRPIASPPTAANAMPSVAGPGAAAGPTVAPAVATTVTEPTPAKPAPTATPKSAPKSKPTSEPQPQLSDALAPVASAAPATSASTTVDIFGRRR